MKTVCESHARKFVEEDMSRYAETGPQEELIKVVFHALCTMAFEYKSTDEELRTFFKHMIPGVWEDFALFAWDSQTFRLH